MTPRRSPTERLEELVEKKTQIEAQIEALDARKRLQKAKDDDRLRWLLGSLVFDRLEDAPDLRNFVRRELPARLTERDRKRELWKRLFPENGEHRS